MSNGARDMETMRDLQKRHSAHTRESFLRRAASFHNVGARKTYVYIYTRGDEMSASCSGSKASALSSRPINPLKRKRVFI